MYERPSSCPRQKAGLSLALMGLAEHCPASRPRSSQPPEPHGPPEQFASRRGASLHLIPEALRIYI